MSRKVRGAVCVINKDSWADVGLSPCCERLYAANQQTQVHNGHKQAVEQSEDSALCICDESYSWQVNASKVQLFEPCAFCFVCNHL